MSSGSLASGGENHDGLRGSLAAVRNDGRFNPPTPRAGSARWHLVVPGCPQPSDPPKPLHASRQMCAPNHNRTRRETMGENSTSPLGCKNGPWCQPDHCNNASRSRSENDGTKGRGKGVVERTIGKVAKFAQKRLDIADPAGPTRPSFKPVALSDVNWRRCHLHQSCLRSSSHSESVLAILSKCF